MVDDAKRWRFLLAGFVEVNHLYDDDGNMIGMTLDSDMGSAECFSPVEINAVLDRWIMMTSYNGSIH